MSQLSPAGQPIIQNSEPVKGDFGHGKHHPDSAQFTKEQVERRSGVLDRRLESVERERRQGDAERRKVVVAETSQEDRRVLAQRRTGEQGDERPEFVERRDRFADRRVANVLFTSQFAERGFVTEAIGKAAPKTEPAGPEEPVHVVDVGGHLMPNENAGVMGVSDIERVTDAIEKGKPVASAEAGMRGLPESIMTDTKVPVRSAVEDRLPDPGMRPMEDRRILLAERRQSDVKYTPEENRRVAAADRRSQAGTVSEVPQ